MVAQIWRLRTDNFGNDIISRLVHVSANSNVRPWSRSRDLASRGHELMNCAKHIIKNLFPNKDPDNSFPWHSLL